MTSSVAWLTIVFVLSIVALLFLVMRTKLQAFVALIVVSFLVGLAVGLPPAEIISTIEEGMGGTLGFIAVVIGLGAMFGEVLRASGGTERLALTLIDKFGEKNIHWALAITGFLVAIPVFIDVAIVMLVPLLYSLVGRTKRSLLFYGLPLLAGLSVTHKFLPPTPGPISVASIIGADLGWVILFGTIVGIPSVILGGPMFAKFMDKRMFVDVPEYMQRNMEEMKEEKDLPSFRSIISIILLPLILILLNTGAALVLEEGTVAQQILTFIGDPFFALTVALLLALYVFGIRQGYEKKDLQQITTKALEPVGIIILVTGAGGVFGEMLISTGIGDVLANAMESANMPLIVFAFITSLIIRLAQGSATVAMVTSAGLVAPLLGTYDVSQPMMGLLVISIASGATAFSHVNDSGFWLFNRYFGLNEKDTLKTWTVMETIIGFTGFICASILSLFV